MIRRRSRGGVREEGEGRKGREVVVVGFPQGLPSFPSFLVKLAKVSRLKRPP